MAAALAVLAAAAAERDLILLAVGGLDLDLRQQSFFRYLDNRAAHANRHTEDPHQHTRFGAGDV